MTPIDAINDKLLRQAITLLENEYGVAVTDVLPEKFAAHLALIKRWNRHLGLVSAGDLTHLVRRHLLDALGLVPSIIAHGGPAAVHLDIGSGGGFPGIPIKCVLPELSLTLIERDHGKVGFLLQAATAVGAPDIVVVAASFPDIRDVASPTTITARAVERPRQLAPAILRWMPKDCVFLCQMHPEMIGNPEMFHVEHIDDPWRRHGWRRSELYAISHRRPL